MARGRRVAGCKKPEHLPSRRLYTVTVRVYVAAQLRRTSRGANAEDDDDDDGDAAGLPGLATLDRARGTINRQPAFFLSSPGAALTAAAQQLLGAVGAVYVERKERERERVEDGASSPRNGAVDDDLTGVQTPWLLLRANARDCTTFHPCRRHCCCTAAGGSRDPLGGPSSIHRERERERSICTNRYVAGLPLLYRILQ